MEMKIMLACEICGKTDGILLPIISPYGTNEIHWICRHGHIDCWAINPLTGDYVRFTEGELHAETAQDTKLLEADNETA
jgi:hypothetical protein